ncbi:unnamed protein product [Mytilus coruscus]|uniref:Uncharacterized protein n=1 Tax=Mytilus coruscus TaxID=42192 RepID=A0A6J8AWR6_MYTCO|nr:unnamed protein product [Mytilus coruscus]
MMSKTCDLTTKERKYIKLNSTITDRAIKIIVDQYKIAINIVNNYQHAEIKNFDCPLLSISNWNKNKGHKRPETYKVEDFLVTKQIQELNGKIYELNSKLNKTSVKIKSIACDDCDKWTHRNCIGMSTSEYSNLCKSEDTRTCPSCCKTNNSSTKIYFIPNGDDSKHSTLNISTNPLMADSRSKASIPSTSGSSINSPSFNSTSFNTDIPIMTLSPKPTKTKPASKKQSRILNIRGKLLEAIIESTEPGVIKGTETSLDSNIKSSEIIPDYFHYDMERRDRTQDPHVGVMIAAKQTLHRGTS